MARVGHCQLHWTQPLGIEQRRTQRDHAELKKLAYRCDDGTFSRKLRIHRLAFVF